MLQPSLIISVLLSLSLLQACGSSDSYSFDELIGLRLADDQSVNGKTITIEANLSSDLVPFACPAVAPIPCANPENEDLSTYTIVESYGHFNNIAQFGCGSPGIRMISTDRSNYEELRFDYATYFELINVSENSEAVGIFNAEVEYIDAIDYCTKEIFKGMRITLSDGEHQRIFDLFNDI